MSDIPPLNGSGEMGEGPTDFCLWVRPEGTVKAVMVFVDFEDAPAGDASAEATADHLLGNGDAAQKLFCDQSYNNLTLDVTVRSDLGWRTMPEPATDYSFDSFDSHKTYIHDAAEKFCDVRFSDYSFVFIVASRCAPFPLSPAFTAPKGEGVRLPKGGEIRWAVTFGQDSYENRYICLVHEVGHLFGLPDLYPQNGNANNYEVGCWDIMSDIFHSVSFLGWHRHKNGWLASSRNTYISQNTSGWNATLTPLSDASGFVARNKDHSEDYGYLFKAPYNVGDVVGCSETTASIEIEVLRKMSSSYDIVFGFKIG